MKTYVHLWYLVHFFLEWEVLQVKVVEKIKTYNLNLVTFFQRSCCLWDNVEKYYTTRQTTGNNMITHALCMRDIGYRYTLKILNNFCFFMAPVVRRTHPDVKLYEHCLSCRSEGTLNFSAIFIRAHNGSAFINYCILNKATTNLNHLKAHDFR